MIPTSHSDPVPSIVPLTPSALSELMALDPLQLTKDDSRLVLMIEEFRKSRAAYDAGNKRAGSTKPKPAAKKAPGAGAAKISLEDLGLG